jgi:hypothetical protein
MNPYNHMKGIVFDSGLIEFDLGLEFKFAVMILDTVRFVIYPSFPLY